MMIDLTHTIAPGMPVYPGTPAAELTPACTLTRNGYRETLVHIGSHTGTHMDAPAHLLQNGAGLESLPVSQFCGRAAVVDVSALGEGGIITAAHLKTLGSQLLCAGFVLFYTGWEKKWGEADYFSGFPVPDAEAAKYLVSCGLKGVGTDSISVDPTDSQDLPVHRTLLGGGLVIVENLRLKKLVGRENVQFYALPLKFEKSDGAPVRAIAEFRDFSEKESDAR